MSAHKDLLSLLDLHTEEINNILFLGKQMKDNRHNRTGNELLRAKTGVLLFEKPSLRTRITFETAINELGGHTINLSSQMVRLGERESVKDVALNLNRWVHLAVIRTFSHSTLVTLSQHCNIPVINALTDSYHPCQALAFGLTLREHIDHESNMHVVFVGDGNNVCASIMVLCAKLGYHFTQVAPRSYMLDNELLATAREIGSHTGANIATSHDPYDAVSSAQVIYTDVWTSMGQEKEVNARKQAFGNFQVNGRLLDAAPDDVLVSHCLPAHREEEITSDVLDSSHCIAFDEAENRLHVQKAIISYIFS